MAYYNTTGESGESLRDKAIKAKSQKEKILWGVKYCTNTYSNFYTSSSSILSAEWCGEKTPITSIRRAISDLVSEGELVYTGEKRTGMYGSPERLVKLNTAIKYK